MTEEVSVTSRVTEVQSTSGERSFALESEALTNIAASSRQLFNLMSLVPGAVQNGTGARRSVPADGFTVNGQRPNSNNVTIDGVANIDTGDNGGNMVTTNLDSVAEFKVLTNAYQAEYGRAVGGQLQVVTKSGTQAFHDRATGMDGARTGTPTRGSTSVTPEIPQAETSRNDSGYTIGGPIMPGFNEDKKRLFFFWSQEWQRRTDPAAERQARVPTALERAGDFSQSVDASGSRSPTFATSTGLPCSASNTSGCFQSGGVLGRIPANRIYGPASPRSTSTRRRTSPAATVSTSPARIPTARRAANSCSRMDFQATNNWRITGRYMKNSEDILQAMAPRGPATAATTSRCRCSSCTPARTTCSPNRYPEQHHDTRAQLGGARPTR